MYLKTVILENFQGFERGEFTLSPHLNILVGVSNVGKSSVARALSLILYNQWDKSWVRFGSKYCRVTLETSNGITVVREKGDKVNRYILRIPNQPEQIFESFGTSTPEQIQQALKIHDVQIDTTDKLNLNLAGQMDALFLLSQTGSYRAKVLGKLSGATYLDHSIRALNTQKRKITGEKEVEELKAVDLKIQVDKYAKIETYSETILALNDKLHLIELSQARIERIRSLVERVNALKDSWTREKAKEMILQPIDLKRIELLPKRVDKINTISSFLSKVVAFKQTFSKENKLNEILTAADLSVINRLAEKNSTFKIKNDLGKHIIENHQDKIKIAATGAQIASDYDIVKNQYADKLREVGVCPICNRSTSEITI